MINKYKTALTPQDRADKRSLRTLQSVIVINKPAVTDLIGSMSDRIRPRRIVWKADGSLNNVFLTEDLKPDARAAATARKKKLYRLFKTL